MSGALTKLGGVEVIDLEAGKRPFKVKYDSKKTELSKILAAIKETGESASKMD